MTPVDTINGLMELGGAGFQALNVKQLLKDRKISGVHWAPTAFFAGWGFWNIVFYGSLHQWLSLTAGLLLSFINAYWLFLLWRFHAQDRHAV